jgi:hypothetical protein
MKATAEIIVTYWFNQLNGERHTEVEWVGPVHGIVAADRYILDTISLPWPYEGLEDDWPSGRVFICRTDYPWPLACNRLQVEADRFSRFWDRLQYRLIYTAQVWGLAYVAPGHIPDWGCIGKKSPWRN